MAIPTRDEFIQRRPEFKNAPAALVEKAIADAQLEVDSVAFGVRYDMAVELRACHLLALSPFGRTLKLVAKDESTIYEKKFYELRAMVPKKMLGL